MRNVGVAARAEVDVAAGHLRGEQRRLVVRRTRKDDVRVGRSEVLVDEPHAKAPRPVALVQLEEQGVVTPREVERDHVVVVALRPGLVTREDDLAVDAHAHPVVAAEQHVELGGVGEVERPCGVRDDVRAIGERVRL